MASGKDNPRGGSYPAEWDKSWCHLHSRPVLECRNTLCAANAGDQNYNPGVFLKSGPPKPASSLGDAIVTPQQTYSSDLLSPATQVAIELRYVYDSLIAVSFSPSEALYLTAVQATGNPGVVPGVTPPSDDPTR